MGVLVGPGEVLAAASAAAGVLTPVASSSVSGVRGSRAEWAAALAELQRVADVVAAGQDSVLVALAAVEEEWAEDGTVREVHGAAGHVAVDAAAVVSGVLCVSAVAAERRVRSAVRLAADGLAGSSSSSGLGGLYAATAAGRLDGYRAGVVAEELEAVPVEVAASVVAAVEPFFGSEDGAGLRRRCRRVVARVSPDLLRQRAVRARAGSRLERWAAEPGVDCWHGTFPSEEAARAWAAVDASARRYVADGTCAAAAPTPAPGARGPTTLLTPGRRACRARCRARPGAHCQTATVDESSPAPALPPPGWYPAADGRLCWWDGGEAVNAQIWFLLASAIGFVAWVVTVLVTVATQQEAVMAVGALVWIWLAVVMVSATVLSVIGAVRAGRHEWWRYPGLPHRVVAGARTGR